MKKKSQMLVFRFVDFDPLSNFSSKFLFLQSRRRGEIYECNGIVSLIDNSIFDVYFCKPN